MVATHCAVMCGLFVHALRCALLLVSLVFVELFFGESPSLHYLFLHFFHISDLKGHVLFQNS